MVGDECAGLVAAGNDVDDAGRQSSLHDDFRKEQGGEVGIGGGLEDNGIAHRNRGCDLPCQHQQGEVPRDDLADNADGLVLRQFGLHQLCPARVMIKMAGDKRHIQITRFTDGLAVVH